VSTAPPVPRTVRRTARPGRPRAFPSPAGRARDVPRRASCRPVTATHLGSSAVPEPAGPPVATAIGRRCRTPPRRRRPPPPGRRRHRPASPARPRRPRSSGRPCGARLLKPDGPSRPRPAGHGREVGISPDPCRRPAGAPGGRNSVRPPSRPPTRSKGSLRSRAREGKSAFTGIGSSTGPRAGTVSHVPPRRVRASCARPGRAPRRRSGRPAAPPLPGRTRPARRSGARAAAAPSSTA
jgi:hypothetical protein